MHWLHSLQCDQVSFETLAAAHGLAGDAAAAESAVAAMHSAGLQPTSYAYCSLISAHRCHTARCATASMDFTAAHIPHCRLSEMHYDECLVAVGLSCLDDTTSAALTACCLQ